MKGEDIKQLEMIRKRLRSEQKEKKLKQMRQQILSNWVSKQEENSIDYLLRFAILKIEQNQTDFLTIYVNIQNIIWECLLETKQYSKHTKILALWLFITLTNSRQVLEQMINQSFKANWNRLLKLLQKYSKFSECLYQKMKTFLQIFCDKYQIMPYHNEDSQNLPQETREVFSEQTTNFLIEIEFEQNEESQYYQLMMTYLSFVPKQHIIPIINQGFGLRTLEMSNMSIYLATLSRLQSLSKDQVLYQQIYQDFLSKADEKKMIFHNLI